MDKFYVLLMASYLTFIYSFVLLYFVYIFWLPFNIYMFKHMT